MITTNEFQLEQTKKLQHIIRHHALEELPFECCGLVLLNSDHDVEVFKCHNSAEDKANFYKISAEEYLIATSVGKIFAVYHSHPQGEPEFSEADKAVSNEQKIDAILYHIETDQFKEYRPKCKKQK